MNSGGTQHSSRLPRYTRSKTITPKVSWHHALWFQRHFPRFSFIAWLAIIRDKLPTDGRVKSWAQLQDSLCEFCGEIEESRGHLVFFFLQWYGFYLFKFSRTHPTIPKISSTDGGVPTHARLEGQISRLHHLPSTLDPIHLRHLVQEEL